MNSFEAYGEKRLISVPSAGIAMNVAPLYFSKPKKKFSKS